MASSQQKGLAQYDPIRGCVVDANNECVSNTVLTALPFLRITPDARSGAMGDVGIGLSADPNAMHFNASKLAFVEDDAAFSATYTPWLRNLNLDDIYMAYLSGYKKVADGQAVGFNVRFFSLGELNFRNIDGDDIGTGKPREFEIGAAYARKLGDNFSAALTAKYINSNLATGQSLNGIDISSATSFAVDVSLTYKKPIDLNGYKGMWTFGTAITNVGSKVSYTDDSRRDFIPTNFGLGTALTLDFDDYNSMTFALDMNKLMVPSPISEQIIDPVTGERRINPEWDKMPMDSIADYRQKGLIPGMLGSFGDAQGGFAEELRELAFSLGVEYWYDKQFAARLGYYYENPQKGNRQFLTVGFGVKYNVFGMDLSYLVPTNNQRNPLDNTLRFTLRFDGSVFSDDIDE